MEGRFSEHACGREARDVNGVWGGRVGDTVNEQKECAGEGSAWARSGLRRRLGGAGDLRAGEGRGATGERRASACWGELLAQKGTLAAGRPPRRPPRRDSHTGNGQDAGPTSSSSPLPGGPSSRGRTARSDVSTEVPVYLLPTHSARGSQGSWMENRTANTWEVGAFDWSLCR